MDPKLTGNTQCREYLSLSIETYIAYKSDKTDGHDELRRGPTCFHSIKNLYHSFIFLMMMTTTCPAHALYPHRQFLSSLHCLLSTLFFPLSKQPISKTTQQRVSTRSTCPIPTSPKSYDQVRLSTLMNSWCQNRIGGRETNGGKSKFGPFFEVSMIHGLASPHPTKY